ncbi:MAG: hypothetical protein ACRC42_04080 [Mycoplasma sp.]
MLFYSKKNIINFVYFDEITNILLIQFKYANQRRYYQLDRSFYEHSIYPEIISDREFRGLIHWGSTRGLVKELTEHDFDYDTFNANFKCGVY